LRVLPPVVLLVCSSLSHGVSSEVVASEAASSAYLDTIVVTASRAEETLADTPARMQVLDATTIASLNPRDVKDALQIVPGLQLRPIHGRHGTEVFLQGMDGNRVLVLVDGLPISPTTGSTADVTQLATLDIQQIEILPGAASALYGSAAMGGVVNVITRPLDAEPRVTLSADAGVFPGKEVHNTPLPQRHYQAVASAGLGDHRLQLSIDRRESSDFDLNRDSYPTNHFDGHRSNIVLRLDSDWENSLGERGSSRFVVEHFQATLENRQLTLASNEGRKEEDLTRWRFVGGGDQEVGLGLLSWVAMWERQTDHTAQLDNSSNQMAGNIWRNPHYQQGKVGLQWNGFDRLSDLWDIELVAGAELFGESIKQPKREIVLKLPNPLPANTLGTRLLDNTAHELHTSEVPFERRRAVELFTQATLDMYASDTFEMDLSPGVRWQNDSDFGNVTTPSVGFRQSIVLANDWSLQTRQSIGVGYRVPNLKERYYLFDHSVHGYKVVGNPTLEPERSRSIQTSLVLSDQKGLQLEVALFNSRIHDLIETEDTGERENNGKVAIHRYANYANTLTRGYDVSARVHILDWLQQRLSYSYLDARDLDKNAPLPNRSKHHAKGYWRVIFTDRLSATVTGEYQSPIFTKINTSITDSETSPAYWRWDVAANLELTDGLRWYSGMKNLTDVVRDPRDENDRRLTEGRYIYTGFELTL